MINDFEDVIGIFPGDLIIKATVELAIDDMRKNPWVIDDVFRALIENPILSRKYGAKEVARAREFILNNNIPVYMRHRVDKQDFPCITISIGESTEDKSLATLGDLSVCVDELSPMDIGKTIKFIIPPFNPVSYDKTQGIVEVPEDIEEYLYINPGMMAVDPDTGLAYEIIEKVAPHSFRIQADAELPKQVAVVPNYQLYRARRERAVSQESYNIGCHTQGDPSTLIFLHCVVKYALFRYRESLLEANNFQLSRLKSTDLIRNDAFGIENIYSRWIILNGQVEESWVKSPMRTIESVVLQDRDADGLQQGLKVCSSDAPEGVEDECSPWITVDDN